jgi:hypothetical protein
MAKYLLRHIWIVILLSACASSNRNQSGSEVVTNNPSNRSEAITSIFNEVDTVNFVQNEFVGDKKPSPLTDLARTEDGAYVLAPGFYETDFKTYCLQPGTPDPSSRDAYFRAPLTGARKEIIETILRNSQKKPYLEQKNTQLLLWSVVSKTEFNKLGPAVQATGRELLTSKQIYELNGGTMGVMKTVARNMPSTGMKTMNGDLFKLFEIGSNSYEAYERLAVLQQPSKISRPDFKRDQWHKQEEGYYVRYMPDSYKNTKIQVYVPNDCVDSTNKRAGEYVVFNPTSLVIVPAWSNAQRLGVGGAVVDIIREVVKIEKKSPPPPPRKQPERKPTTKPQQ